MKDSLKWIEKIGNPKERLMHMVLELPDSMT